MRIGVICIAAAGVCAAADTVTFDPIGERRTILAAEFAGAIRWSSGGVLGLTLENQGGAPLIWSIDRLAGRASFNWSRRSCVTPRGFESPLLATVHMR